MTILQQIVKKNNKKPKKPKTFRYAQHLTVPLQIQWHPKTQRECTVMYFHNSGKTANNAMTK